MVTLVALLAVGITLTLCGLAIVWTALFGNWTQNGEPRR